eukprot:scaffold34601_cov234-Amphora_coffeaeformis.AAC.14
MPKDALVACCGTYPGFTKQVVRVLHDDDDDYDDDSCKMGERVVSVLAFCSRSGRFLYGQGVPMENNNLLLKPFIL